MEKTVYINGIGAVTAQGVWSDAIFDAAVELREALNYAVQPAYKTGIPPAMLRRMSKGIKMGIFASQQALADADIVEPDAILMGTGLGCLEDSEKFLKNVLDNNEEFLTPTSFIQSTHNTVAAQIALRLGCKAYNFTYVNGATSFESALIDGLMQIQAAEAKTVLVGGMDEISGQTFEFKQLVGEINDKETFKSVKENTTTAVNFGEGGTFFGLSSDQNDRSYAALVDVKLINTLALREVADFVVDFLVQNNVALTDVSALIVGINGDIQADSYYTTCAELFNDNIPLLYYKHLVGHSDVASAFGLALAAHCLKTQQIPAAVRWNEAPYKTLRYILCYNQYKGKAHSLTLLKSL
ncbi:beta-ketoacyl synthase N-terminal-like domain-containing protein [Sphingobacterium sp. Mn56C]|uniref:beta-ketoacyl synthase N-terminal-like domain-containing protein n=1 Tax=Sphingobacterium sp. Mn56C TaxID=3395261 RepID=UPI003BDBF39B